MNNDFKEYRDASWEHVSRDGHSYDGATIKFRNNSRRVRISGFFKGIAFVVIAAVSGGATAAYIIDTRYANMPYNYGPNNPSLFEQKQNNTPTAVLPKNAINKVSENVGPTVVGISNKVETFFGEKSNGSGSGIIFKEDGYIVTNYHVIEGAERVTVKLANSNKIFNAKFIGAEPTRDIAVIKIEAEKLPVARFGDSSNVKVGDVAIAIGNPLGDEFAGSVTAGIISAVNRKISIQDRYGKVTTYKVFQTDAAINPGNSGGALVNEAGEIIGINSLKVGASYNAEGMGFAITINEASEIIKRVMGTADNKTQGKDASAQSPADIIGITGRNAIPEEANGVRGVYVESINPNLGAAQAGIRPSDIIVEIEKVKIETMDQLLELLSKYQAGDTVSCKIWRSGKVFQTKVTL
ncbi:trypsin-like peptidase domain-containing protein [Clostridium swellfunianum]|uniref:S1C family serine protease n=1 Tax=Clostridium swellfunianum TaxID=1367462 RepID=UPI00202E55CD|nr:trypsin-like peptidase domain-containing protein [Clostridium swellfunianum]MCM0649014.1 trypsin-like peptidase domain-containing protein [Clostridium swellfunianum]